MKENPYLILDVKPDAKNQEIIDAFQSKLGIRNCEYPQEVITDALNRLLDPQKRLEADWWNFNPIIIDNIDRKEYEISFANINELNSNMLDSLKNI